MLSFHSYLQESGFVHSAFTFVYESMLGRSNIRNADKSIPPGALITFLQKGMQYVGIEESLNREGQKGRKNPEEEFSSLSLLAPQTISALTRENPPIQLNVPPATAAAAVRARLEAEAKLESERKKAAVKEAAEQVLASGATKITGPSGLPPQVSLQDPHQLARNVIASQASVQHQLSQMDSAGAAAAIMAQQRREVAAQMAVLQEEQLHHQLQLQQQLQHEQILQQQPHQMGGPTEETAAAVASVAGQLSGNKRAAATGKKSLKKAKSKQQAKKPTQQSEESEISTTSSSQDTTGFASLGEAAARLEAATGPQITSASDEPTPMDAEENDQTASVPSQPAHVPREKETLNGNHRPPNGTKDGSEPDTPGHHRKEGGPSKGPNAVIDKEDKLTNARPEEVLELNSHSSEVFMCAWNPIFTDIIATGSGDASARIWQMGGKKASDGLGPVCYLPHGSGPEDKMNKDVTTLEWSSDGNLLATGSYDGVARVWNRAGELVKTLRGHKGPIFSLKWNKRGNYLLSGSYDQTTIVWDVSGENGFVEQQFADHTAPALDVDWKDDVTFASCSTDRTVHICRVGTSKPLKVYSGHGDEVNAVKWDPSGRLLASCSDDCTAKVWDVDSDQTGPVQDFRSHKQEIYTVKWCVLLMRSLFLLCCLQLCLTKVRLSQESNRARLEEPREAADAGDGVV